MAVSCQRPATRSSEELDTLLECLAFCSVTAVTQGHFFSINGRISRTLLGRSSVTAVTQDHFSSINAKIIHTSIKGFSKI